MEEGRAGQPKMMSVGLHCRLSRPGRIAALEKFVDFAKSYGRDVWICTREEIANHWYEQHLPRGVGSPIQPTSFTAASTGSRWGIGSLYSSPASSSTPSSPAKSSTTSKFSYLGNLSAPRDSTGSLDKANDPIKAEEAQVPDGDII